MPGLQNSANTLAFLGTIGTTDRGDEFPKSARALVELAAFLIETATDNLERKGNIATGETAKSMKIVNLDLRGPAKSLEVEILSTYKFLDKGVKGTEGGRGKYSFKTKYANKKMARAILRWLKKRSLGGRTKYKAVSRGEKKNKRINKAVNSVKSRESLAYAVATNIKKKGINPTLFFTNAVKATEKRSKKLFGDAIKVDIIESLKRK